MNRFADISLMAMKFTFSKGNILQVFIGIALFFFIFCKAYISSFTHDESYSYLHYVHESFKELICYSSCYSNNHQLNTIFMKYSEMLFGSSELALRLPNLILCLIYFRYAYLITNKMKGFLGITFYIVLCANSPLIDFFGLARGYGMSFGFMMMSLYHFIQVFNSDKKKNLVLFHLGSLLSVMSNFSLLQFYISLVFIFFILIFIQFQVIEKRKFKFWTESKLHILFFLVCVVVLYMPIGRVITNNNFDFGGKNNFIEDTITHLIYTSIYGFPVSNTWLIVVQFLFMVILLGAFTIVVIKILKRNIEFLKDNRELIICNLLMVSISVIILLEHWILHIDYPIGRFSLYLFPIMVLNLGFLLNYFVKSSTQILIYSFAIILSINASYSFVKKADFYVCSEWGYDSSTKEMIQKLVAYHSLDKDLREQKLGINWVFEPSINFYRTSLKLYWLLPVDRDGITGNENFIYSFNDEIGQLKILNSMRMFEFPKSNTCLLKINK